MLTIRLRRTGKKNQPFFKIVVTEHTKSSTGGRFVEELGFYNPLTKERSLKGERAKYWMSVGAQPSETVYNMLVSEKVLEGKKIPKHKKSKKKQAEPEQKPEAKQEVEPHSAEGGSTSAQIAEEPKPTPKPAPVDSEPKPLTE